MRAVDDVLRLMLSCELYMFCVHYEMVTEIHRSTSNYCPDMRCEY